MKKSFILLSFILLIAFVLRFYQLGQIPPSLNGDEASIGYNAYSILKTGKDEWGQNLPLFFKAFGEYKLPLYIYLTVPSIAVFGLTEFAIRFPSALFGVLTVLLVYFLVKELFKTHTLSTSEESSSATSEVITKNTSDGGRLEQSGRHDSSEVALPLLATVFVALSPWHIFYSRAAFEANILLFLIVLGLWLFLKSFQKKYLLPVSILSFLFSLYTYKSALFFVPLLILVLVFLYRKEVEQISKKYLVLSLAIAVILVFPVVFNLKTPVFSYTAQGVNIASQFEAQRQLFLGREEHLSLTSLPTKIFHNNLVLNGILFLQNYIQSYSPQFLFVSGSVVGLLSVPAMGQLYLIEALFLIFGFYFLVRENTSRKAKYFLFKQKTRESFLIFIYLLLAPITSALTRNHPHPTRMLYVAPILSLVSALGVLWLWKKLKYAKKLIFAFLMLGFLFNFLFFLDAYFTHLPKRNAALWGFGYREIARETVDLEASYSKVVVSSPRDTPYIYFLFYKKYDPAKFQKEAIHYPLDAEGFQDVKSFGKYEFRNFVLAEEKGGPALYIGRPDALRGGEPYITKTIFYPNQTQAFWIVAR